MRVLLAFLLLIGTVTSQIDKFLYELPDCAIRCAFTFVPHSGCSLTDIDCICHNEELWVDMETCAVANCTTREGLASQTIAADACEWPVRDKGIEIAILGPVSAAVALIFVVIRLVARQQVMGQIFGWDDIAIVLAWCGGVPLAVFDVLFWKHGLGQDIWRVPFDDITQLLRYFYAGELAYVLSTVLVKVALLLFFLRIFPNYWFRQWTKAMLWICAAFAFGFIWPLVFQCAPVDYAWTRWDGEHEGKCIDVYVGGFVHAALNMVLDIIILLMPMPLLYRLQLKYSWRQRWHVFVMFSFGVIVTVVCMLRLNSLITFGKSLNPTWDYMGGAVWSMIEVQVSIICACLPAAKAFFAKLLPNCWLLTTQRSGRSDDPESQQPATLPNEQDTIGKESTIKSPSRLNVSIMAMTRNDTGFTELVEIENQVQPSEPAEFERPCSPSRDHIVRQFARSNSPISDRPGMTPLFPRSHSRLDDRPGSTIYDRCNSRLSDRPGPTIYERSTCRLDQVGTAVAYPRPRMNSLWDDGDEDVQQPRSDSRMTDYSIIMEEQRCNSRLADVDEDVGSESHLSSYGIVSSYGLAREQPRAASRTAVAPSYAEAAEDIRSDSRMTFHGAVENVRSDSRASQNDTGHVARCNSRLDQHGTATEYPRSNSRLDDYPGRTQPVQQPIHHQTSKSAGGRLENFSLPRGLRRREDGAFAR